MSTLVRIQLPPQEFYRGTESFQPPVRALFKSTQEIDFRFGMLTLRYVRLHSSRPDLFSPRVHFKNASIQIVFSGTLRMPKMMGMMQPYLFPYLGYFQLIAGTDVFVLGDDLQYVKESWMNRNRILVDGKARLITFPLKKGNHLQKINERIFCDNFSGEMDRLLKVIFHSYLKAPYFVEVFPLLEEIIRFPENNLAKYTENSIRKICAYLKITTPIFISSDLAIEDVLDKQDRVIQTVKKLKGDVYVNPIGGVDLYDADYFKEHGIALKFHRMNDIEYSQHGNEFVPLLSIIDVLMFNERSEVQKKLSRYSLEDRFGNSV